MAYDKINEIIVFLTAQPPGLLRRALKIFNRKKRAVMKEARWEIWPEGEPPATVDGAPVERARFHDQWYIRPAPEYDVLSVSKETKSESNGTFEVNRCPACGDKMFPQPVCPNCEKGKAGLKTQWICGNDASHFFYTEA
jgi:hypothetical protein